ncbi:MAG TPA: alpha/beta fold hydrolase [Terracidiphilus sp.]|jgi:pimeloyl-ACP methyl ester carboxylesterase
MKTRGIGRWVALVILALILIAGVAFWERPLAVFSLFTEAQMFLHGAKSHYTVVNGYRIHYYDLGPADGKAVVLVHGLGGRSEDWEKLAPHLAKAGYRVYMPDLPGYGRSQKPADFSYSVTDESGVVVGLLDVLGLKQVDLGGWSMGGWIAQLVAVKHPDRVRRLMLFDSAGLSARPEWDIGLFTPISAAQLDELDALLMPNPPKVPGFVARDILRRSHEHAWVMRRALATMLQGRETTDKLLPELRMPVLIVWGEVDHITPLSQGDKMHQLIPQSELDVISGCGHLAPNACAAEVAPIVVNFLGR